jgi:hypothetical protein
LIESSQRIFKITLIVKDLPPDKICQGFFPDFNCLGNIFQGFFIVIEEKIRLGAERIGKAVFGIKLNCRRKRGNCLFILLRIMIA